MDKLTKPPYFTPHLVDYADKHSVYAIIEDLLKRIIVSKPEDPITFLINTLKHVNLSSPSCFVIGPPCSGKYTLGEYIAERIKCVHIPVGLINQNVASETNNRTELCIEFLKNRLSQDDCEKNGYILTGFPSNREEGRALQKAGIFPEKICSLSISLFVISLVILNASDQVLKDRAIQLVNSGKLYTLRSNDYLDSDDTVKKPSDYLDDFDARLDRYRHNIITLRQLYKVNVIDISAYCPQEKVFHEVLTLQTRPNRNLAMWTPRIVILGFSGSGRKTVTRKLASKCKLVPIHCGTLIRREVAMETKLGLDMKPFVDIHNAVPDEMVIELMKNYLSEPACAVKGWILIGYPRNKIQAQALDDAKLSPNRVIFLDINRPEAIKRLKAKGISETDESLKPASRKPWLQPKPDQSEANLHFKLNRFASHRVELDRYYGKRALCVDADKDEQEVFEVVKYLIYSQIPRAF